MTRDSRVPSWRKENTMPILLRAPIKKQFHLEKSDAELGVTDGATMVTIRQATQGDYELRNDLTSEFKREYDGVLIRVVQRISFDDIKRREVFLTLCACNIISEGKKPLFRFDNGKLRDEVEFRDAWYKLEPIIADEIHEKVLEMNPLWNDGTLPKQTEADTEVVGEPATGEHLLQDTSMESDQSLENTTVN